VERSKKEQLVEGLEKAIDATSFSDVLEALSAAAYLKAEHLASNWQDSGTAKLYERLGTKLDALSVTVNF